MPARLAGILLAALFVAAAVDPLSASDTVGWPPAAPPLPSPSSPAWPPAGHVRHSPPASRASVLSTAATATGGERVAGTAWTSPGSRQSAAGGASSSKDSPHEPHKHPLPTVLPSQTAACNADAGVLGCWESGCMHECTAQMLGTFSRFSIVCMASHTFGGMLSPFGFPGITLFLGFGVLTLVALALALALALTLTQP